jgi:peptidoglycan/xylan/chitin deacetylase (PgdA/CDA1 family)
MKPKIIVTTSWDDGHILDLKLAELLARYNLPGTFYVAPEDREFEESKRLTDKQILQLSRQFEIGAHTLTHPRLPKVSDISAAHEINDSKSVLEDIIGRPITTFCYPGGAYTQTHVREVRDAGYTYARTIQRYKFAIGNNRLTAPTSIHAYRHWLDLPRIIQVAKLNPLSTLEFFRNWDSLAIAVFDQTVAKGGVYHLWGHSWEIDAAGDWNRLERVMRHIAGRDNVSYLTNGAL